MVQLLSWTKLNDVCSLSHCVAVAWQLRGSEIKIVTKKNKVSGNVLTEVKVWVVELLGLLGLPCWCLSMQTAKLFLLGLHNHSLVHNHDASDATRGSFTTSTTNNAF